MLNKEEVNDTCDDKKLHHCSTFMVGTELSQSMLEIVTCLESMSKLNTTLVCFGTKKTVLNSTSLDSKVCFKFVSGGK